MPTIRIRDLRSGCLAFDLADLLELLGDALYSSRWRCSVDECISAPGARPDLEATYNQRDWLSGAEIIELARETSQVIDGHFEAFTESNAEPWVTFEAIDSSYWELSAPTSDVLAQFESHFQSVERCS